MTSIAIIVCTYDGAPYISATLDSIVAQTHRDWRLKVVDDGSSDSTPDIVRAYARRDARISLVEQPNLGEAAARNRGLAACDDAAEYVAFIDHDDVWEPDALEVLLRGLEEDPTACGAHGLARYIDQSGAPIRNGEGERWTRERRALIGRALVDWPVSRPTVFETFLATNPILSHGQVLIRRRAVLDAGPFDETTAPSSDWDHWLRISSRGHFRFVDRLVLGYRLHDRNMSRARREMERARRRIFEKLAACPSLTERQREAVQIGYRLGLKEVSDLWLGWARRSADEHHWLTAINQVRHAGIERVRYYRANVSAATAARTLEGRSASPTPSLRQMAVALGGALVDVLTLREPAPQNRRSPGLHALMLGVRPEAARSPRPTGHTRAA